MKKLFITTAAILSLLISPGFSQTFIASAPWYFNTALGDMKIAPGNRDKAQAFASGLNVADDENGGNYRWDATSTITDDGFLNISVPGITVGRWHRVGNGNTLKFTITFTSSVIGNSTYNHVYTTPLPFMPSNIFIQAATLNAVRNAVPRASITKNGFQVQFEQILPLSQPVSFDALIIKQ